MVTNPFLLKENRIKKIVRISPSESRMEMLTPLLKNLKAEQEKNSKSLLRNPFQNQKAEVAIKKIFRHDLKNRSENRKTIRPFLLKEVEIKKVWKKNHLENLFQNRKAVMGKILLHGLKSHSEKQKANQSRHSREVETIRILKTNPSENRMGMATTLLKTETVKEKSNLSESRVMMPKLLLKEQEAEKKKLLHHLKEQVKKQHQHL